MGAAIMGLLNENSRSNYVPKKWLGITARDKNVQKTQHNLEQNQTDTGKV